MWSTWMGRDKVNGGKMNVKLHLSSLKANTFLAGSLVITMLLSALPAQAAAADSPTPASTFVSMASSICSQYVINSGPT